LTRICRYVGRRQSRIVDEWLWRRGPGGLAIERKSRLRLGGRRGNLSVDPRKPCPPGLCRCAGRPSSAAPDLTCPVSIARERPNYKGPGGCLNADVRGFTKWARPPTGSMTGSSAIG
jgi:hypothetical protein